MRQVRQRARERHAGTAHGLRRLGPSVDGDRGCDSAHPWTETEAATGCFHGRTGVRWWVGAGGPARGAHGARDSRTARATAARRARETLSERRRPDRGLTRGRARVALLPGDLVEVMGRIISLRRRRLTIRDSEGAAGILGVPSSLCLAESKGARAASPVEGGGGASRFHAARPARRGFAERGEAGPGLADAVEPDRALRALRPARSSSAQQATSRAACS